MDPESIGKETIIRVTDWLRGIWEMRRRAGQVQQWVDSIPSPTNSSIPNPNIPQEDPTEKFNMSMTPTEPKDIPFPMGTKVPTMTVSAPINVPNSPTVSTTGLPSSLPYRLVRDPSLQSDSSHCSSVESLLELRKADPEAILLGLGFGGCSSSPQENGSLSRIPKRFLQPSRLKGIAINDFVKHQQETSESFDSVSLGYRGLTGSPYVAPSEIVQKIMDRLRENESHETDPYAMYNCYEQYSPIQQNGKLSVLSPDNRQFLERPRSKSPDMCNKRMIIGQKSFAFGHDGDLIEIDFSDPKELSKNSIKNDQSSVENSGAHVNVEDLNTERNKTLRLVPAPKIGKRLAKQISFDDNVEIFNSDSNPIAPNPEKPQERSDEDPDRVTFQKTDITNAIHNNKNDDITSKHSETRRASDGSCDVKSLECRPTREGRRHSDTIVHTIENPRSHCTLSQKRKTMKRQPRVYDLDALDYCEPNTFISSTPTEKHSHFSLDVERDTFECDTVNESGQSESARSANEGIQLLGKNESCGTKCPETFFEGTHSCVQTIDDTMLGEMRLQANDKCNSRQNPLCHDEGKTEELCTNTEDCTSRCCHTNTAKYWKKMEKIMQENKKLETMVAKNRREMAEIREMLNSVLSVRMEPGF